MKALKLTILVTLIFSQIGCSDKDNQNTTIVEEPKVSVNKSLEAYQAIKSNTSDITNDPYELKDISYEDGIIKITVSYGGGCKPHYFTVTWDEAVKYSYPPIIDLIITHNANGDLCEAYITETLEIDTELLFDSITIQNLSVNAFNGYAPEDSITKINDTPAFEIPEGEVCEIPVTAKRVACGNGLFENLWFALEDSIHGNDTTYYSKYLQPVKLSGNISDFVPQEGEKYLLGVQIQQNHSFTDETACMAYSGPFIPVFITCVSETK